ncbi:MAG TPA: class I SAM-dependent methyltransferase [Candidatus Aenigmarchaeota archaeon]|nr:class I SAM-dependent methyltransferase [Candidatus Aenigmarchaeota archaeon]
MSTSIYSSWQSLQKQKFVEMKKHLGSTVDEIFRAKLVLDIGCGFGYFEKSFKGKFVGLDNDLTMLRGNVAIFPRVFGDGDRLPFKDEAFDTVISIDTMHLLKNNDFFRVLKPGGTVLLSVFFNNDNYLDRRDMLLKKVKNMEVIKEFDILGREKEFVVVVRK